MFIVFVIFYFPSGTDLPTAMGKKKLFVCVYGTLYQIVYQNAFPRQIFELGSFRNYSFVKHLLPYESIATQGSLLDKLAMF